LLEMIKLEPTKLLLLMLETTLTTKVTHNQRRCSFLTQKLLELTVLSTLN
jgi:hypothetical protein